MASLVWGTSLNFTFGTGNIAVTASKPFTAIMFCGSTTTTNFCIPTVFSETSGSYRVSTNSRNFESGYGGGYYGSMIATWTAAEFSGIPSVDLGSFDSQSDLYAAIKAYDIGSYEDNSGEGGGDGGDGGEGGDGDDENGVTEIVLSAVEGAVKPGSSVSVAYVVHGKGTYSKEVTAALSGYFASTCTLGNGVVTVNIGEGEKADSVTLTLTSVENEEITASVSISIDYSDDGDEGGDDSGGGTGGGITPTGTLEITENGVYDVTEYAEVNVNVQATEEIKAAFMSGLATGLALYSIGV